MPDEFYRDVARLETDPLCPELCAYNARDFGALSRFARERLPGSRAVPFWGLVWPGSRALARLVLDRADEFAGRRLLDLGCGSGLAAVAAARAGCKATGIDLDPLALDVARRMAAANEVTCDWRAGDAFALGDDELNRFDCIVAGDLFYEDGLSKRALAFLERAGQNGRRVFVADPDRGEERLRRERRLRVALRLRVPVYPLLENVRERDVTIYAWDAAR